MLSMPLLKLPWICHLFPLLETPTHTSVEPKSIFSGVVSSFFPYLVVFLSVLTRGYLTSTKDHIYTLK